MTSSTERICSAPGASRGVERRWTMSCSERSWMRRIVLLRLSTVLPP